MGERRKGVLNVNNIIPPLKITQCGVLSIDLDQECDLFFLLSVHTRMCGHWLIDCSDYCACGGLYLLLRSVCSSYWISGFLKKMFLAVTWHKI